jgi:ABC-type oligopeptide transport system ATPase subunit
VTPLIEGRGIVKRFAGRGRSADVLALDDVDIAVGMGELVGIVGESGSGKSTLSRILVGIERATTGTVLHNGEPVLDPVGWKGLRRDVQYVFQDPYMSLAPHLTVGRSIVDGLDIRGEGTPSDRAERVAQTLERVGLKASDALAYPAVFSGGQRQRICLARALVLDPKIIICDEIVSGLDVSVQAQILNLLVELHVEQGVGLVFVSHDLRVVKYLCQRIIVMHRGHVVEANETEALFSDPQHEYTRHLLDCVPVGLASAGA